MKQAPCKDCENRQHGCHGKCEKYAEWKAEGSRAWHNKMALKSADDFRTASFMKAKHDWIRSHK